MTALLPYQDPARSIDERVEDLLARMTLEERAGLMFQTMLMIPPDGSFDPDNSGPFGFATPRQLLDKELAHFNLVGSAPPVVLRICLQERGTDSSDLPQRAQK